MPSRVIRRSTRRRVRSRRRVQWADRATDVTAVGIGQFQVVDLLQTYRSMAGAETTGITIQRVHLRVWVTTSITTGDGIAVGMAVDDIGEVVGNTAIGAAHAWDPVDQPYLSWMVYQRFNAHPQYDFSGGTSGNLEFDVRSKRKVPFGDTLLLSLVNIDAAAAVSFSIHSRALLALS